MARSFLIAVSGKREDSADTGRGIAACPDRSALEVKSITMRRHPLPDYLPERETIVLRPILLTSLLASLATSAFADGTELELTNQVALVRIATAGGSITHFQFIGQFFNPLNWNVGGPERPEKDKPRAQGHFLCLDRWGAPSAAEAERGMPFHGEAAQVHWQISQPPTAGPDGIRASMGSRLEMAGLSVRRDVTLLSGAAVVLVTEHVVNQRPLGRVYNMVQHPTIGPPFLHATTLVDSNATLGLSQDGPLPQSASQANRWPHCRIGERTVNLRHYKPLASGENDSDVSSYIFDEATRFGWVTAVTPGARLLLGYLWNTSEYPWLNIWRAQARGIVGARGLEFGTTGLHRPYPELVRRGKLLDRPLVSFIDAGESVARSYVMFLLAVPENYAGVQRIEVAGGKLTLIARDADSPSLSVNVRLPWPE